MLLAEIVTERLHILDKIMAAGLLLFKVNPDLVDVFLLLFVLFALIGPDHCVDHGEDGPIPVEAHAEGDGLDRATALEGHHVAGGEAGGGMLAESAEHVFFVGGRGKSIGVRAIVWFLNFHGFDIFKLLPFYVT